MTTVDLLYRYSTPPTEAVAFALAGTRDVYGIRRIQIDATARTVLVEFDATRLNAATVANILRRTGLDIAAEPPADQAAAVPTAAVAAAPKA
jgi:hypothetical protein